MSLDKGNNRNNMHGATIKKIEDWSCDLDGMKLFVAIICDLL
jgi:hypothetical protein